jgi:phage terminase large subunit
LIGQANIITPTPKQREAYSIADKNFITLYGGAIRGGKSYWGCLALITYCFKYPKSRWLILRENLPTIKRNLLPTLNKIIADGFQPYVKSFDQQTFTLTWTNGSQIIIMAESYDTDKELNRFRGLEINGAFLDEANELQENTFNKVIERAGSWFHSPGCPSKILMSANPCQNWLKENFYNKWVNDSLKDGMAYVPAKIFDNPYIPKEYFESLKMLPRYQYEVFVEGNWDVSLKTGGEFYKCFELDKHVGKTIYNPELPLHISWDDNVNPYLPCGVFQIQGKDVRMIDEIAGENPNNTIKAVCNEFKRKYLAHTAGLFVYGDATAQKEDTKLEKGYNFFRLIQDELKEYKPSMRISKSNPSVAMRGMWLNTVLEKELGGIKIIISDNCKKTINDFINTKEAADGTKNKEMETNANKVRFQKVGHFTDLFDYLMCTAFANEFVNYQRGDIQNSFTFGKNKHSKNSY